MNFALLDGFCVKKYKDVIFNVRKQCRMPCGTVVIERGQCTTIKSTLQSAGVGFDIDL